MHSTSHRSLGGVLYPLLPVVRNASMVLKGASQGRLIAPPQQGDPCIEAGPFQNLIRQNASDLLAGSLFGALVVGEAGAGPNQVTSAFEAPL